MYARNKNKKNVVRTRLTELSGSVHGIPEEGYYRTRANGEYTKCHTTSQSYLGLYYLRKGNNFQGRKYFINKIWNFEYCSEFELDLHDFQLSVLKFI